jgi:hypothetical protein
MIEKYVRFVFFTQPSVTATLSPQLAIDHAVDAYFSGVKLRSLLTRVCQIWKAMRSPDGTKGSGRDMA